MQKMISLSDFKKQFKIHWQEIHGYSYDKRPAPHDWRCAIAALLLQDRWGGIILSDEVILPDGSSVSHLWNYLDEGISVDATKDQFDKGSLFPMGEVFSREKILSRPEPRKIYEQMKQMMEK